MDQPRKRRRLLSPDTDLNELRARNDARLKTTFESIFEKYGRDFSGVGDEVDLETGEIVVNNGHLFGMIDEKHMFDEPNTETGSDSPEREKGAGYQRDPPIEITQIPVDRANTDASWLSDDADSLMGDVMVNCLSVVKGSGSQKSRLPVKTPESRKLRPPPSAIANSRRQISAIGRPQPNLSPSTTRPQRHIEVTPKEEPAIETAWCVPPLPKPAPGRTGQPVPSVLKNDKAKSERFLSPSGLSPQAPTKEGCIMPRWTQQEDNLLLYLWSDTTLGYTEVKRHFKERFPHRSFKAIQNHWCQKRRSSSWKRDRQDGIATSSSVEHSVRETRFSESSRIVEDLQQLRSPDPLANHFPENAETIKRGGESTSYETARDRPDVHQEITPSNVPELGIKSSMTRLSQSLQEHARFLSGLSRSSTGAERLGQSLQEHGYSLSSVPTSSTRKQRISLSAAQKAPCPLRSSNLSYSTGHSVAELGNEIHPKSEVVSEGPDSSTAGAGYEPPYMYVPHVSKGQSKTHKNMNIATAVKGDSTKYRHVQRMTSHASRPEGNGSTAMPIDDVRKPSYFKDHESMVQLHSAAAVQASLNANRSTLLRLQASSTHCTDLYMDRKTQPRTLPSLSANHRYTPRRKTPSFSKNRLLSGSQNLLRCAGPSNDAWKKETETMVRAGQVARRKSVGVPIKTPLVTAFAPDQRSPNHNVIADEASCTIKSSPPAESRTSLLPGHLSTSTQPEDKRHVQGVGLASAKSLASHIIDLSDDELSTPIKTVGTPSASRVTSSILKQRRKTLK